MLEYKAVSPPMKNKTLIILLAVFSGVAIIYLIITKTNIKNSEEDLDNYEDNNNQSAEQIENQEENTQTEMPNESVSEKDIITLETSFGNIKIEFFKDDAPKTVNNFLSLASKGFYDGIIFHRVIDGFMIQGGDPTGTGSGGPGYSFEDELNPETESYKRGYVKGTVAMANAGPNTNGSQFFIMVADYPLQHDYTIFGKVIEGQEVADRIAKVKTGVMNRPIEKIVINKAIIGE